MKRLIRKFAFWLLDLIKHEPEKDEDQTFNEHICVDKGHIWRSELDKKHQQSINVETKDRTYCVRCGQKYHKHIYKS